MDKIEEAAKPLGFNVRQQNYKEKIGFEDRDSFEGLFKEYWEIVQEEEGLTMDDDNAANTQLKKKKKKNKNGKCLSVKIGKGQQEEEFITVDSDKEETEPCKPVQLPHHEVDSVIKRYIREKKTLLTKRGNARKRSQTKSRIFHLLEAHLVESKEESQEDVDDGDGDQVRCPKKDENDDAACKKRRTLSSDMENQVNEVETIIKRSSFASIVAENIKLVYLRRSLVELCKQPESFEGKVVGSFLRVKTDSKDFLQKNSHQLLP
ncbi:Uncharacterized protein L484_023427 [Morus notabilis]|uniref:Plus3 domain-containing protein n=1 Tax=Morus notabilis TaxID=981085 RepID=W9S2A8_9ROSA|nr:uncharacterized protein At5g08430 [Morus notabilis]EXB83821.1 Uncharacterized protein L484_023427 [Morus notabilis]